MGLVPATYNAYSTSEVVARVRRKLEDYFEAASAASERPRNVLSLVRYFVHFRHELTGAVQHLRSADEDAHEKLLRQAEIAFLSRPERFANISGRSDLIQAWTTLLIEADEKLEADRRKTEAYRQAAGRGEMDEESGAVAVASRQALRRWQD
jgi:hypothetical protein